MTNTVSLEPITNAVVDALASSGFPVGDHDAPDLDEHAQRYSVVYGIPGAQLDGSWTSPAENVVLVYQVESYGRNRKQAEHHADVNRQLLCGQPVPVDGPWVVVHVYQPDGTVGGVEPIGADQSTKQLFRVVEDFHVQVVRALV